MNQTNGYVYCIHWNEGSFPQIEVFDEKETAEDFADYIKASRGVGTVLNTLPVYGKRYVSMLTGKEYESHAEEVLRAHGFPELRKC